MLRDLSFYDDVEAIERYLNIPAGSLVNIPIYARVPAVDAIIKVKKMEENSVFRSGLYYIVLADLMGNTFFNAKYGDHEGDVRVQWFQTCVIQSLGEIGPTNYATYLKAIGDAALLIFSSFADVIRWSDKLTSNLEGMSIEYREYCENHGLDESFELDELLNDFDLRARRLVHLGEVRFKQASDPICLAVSQIFKAEKTFEEDELGCTQPVFSAVVPLLHELGIEARKHKGIVLAGSTEETDTYYLISKRRAE